MSNQLFNDPFTIGETARIKGHKPLFKICGKGMMHNSVLVHPVSKKNTKYLVPYRELTTKPEETTNNIAYLPVAKPDTYFIKKLAA